MKRLYLLRHAKSSWDDPELADRDRPLAPRGRRALTLAADDPTLERVRERFPTGALATLVLREAPWSALGAGDAELAAYVVPRELD